MLKKNLLTVCCFLLYAACLCQVKGLQYYTENAVQNSPLIKEYNNQAISNTIDSLLIRAALKPQVTGSSINSYAPVIKDIGYDGAITNGGNFSALVGINKQLGNKKNLYAQFENIVILNESLRNNISITIQDLNRNIIAQYITTYGDEQQLNFSKEINTLLTREEIILKKLTQGNVYKQVDYLTFLVTLEQQQLSIKQNAIQFKNDVALLNYLSGITDTNAVSLANPAIVINEQTDAVHSIFSKQYVLDSLQLENKKKLADVNYRPKINVYADAGFNSTLAYQPYKNFGTSAGLSLIVPIYDGKQKKLQYRKIDTEEKTRQSKKDFFEHQYNQQTMQLTQQLQATEDLLRDINQQLKYTQSLIDVNGKLLEAGEARITDYILALNNYINGKNLITQNNITRLQIINQLNYRSR